MKGLTLGLSMAPSAGMSLGPELIGDTGFDNSGYWTSKTGVVVSGSKALFNQPYTLGAPNIYVSTTTYTEGATYAYSITVSNYSSGNVRVGMGWNTINYGGTHTGNGTFTGTLVAGDGSGANSAAGVFGFTDFIGDVDNFSLKKVL